MNWDWETFWYSLLIAILLIAFLYLLIDMIIQIRKRRAGPSHVDLYFQDNFRKIMDEWDLVTRPSVKTFKKDILNRLKVVGTDIDDLEKKKDMLDLRMKTLDKELDRLEVI